MKLRAVAWDIDGTLVDSEPLHLRALIAGCRNFGVDVTDLPDDAFRGIHMQDVWLALRPRFSASVNATDWLAGIARYYITHRHELSLIPHAAETVRELDVPVNEIARDGLLRTLPGVGEAMAGAITSLLETGSFAGHDELTQQFPESLLDLASVPGIGPKSVNKLFTKLKVATLDELAAAAASGRCRTEPRASRRRA